MEILVQEDLFHIEQSLQLFRAANLKKILTDFLKGYALLLERAIPQIDHVGKELFGPLSFYLPLLKEMSDKLGLIYLSEQIFPSLSVIKKLQKNDPDLKEVTIGKIYFRNEAVYSQEICLELFQPSPLDEKKPQKIEATQNRRSLMTDPIDHLAIRVNTMEELVKIQRQIKKHISKNFIAELNEISYNPTDNSFYTKARIKNPREILCNKILEFIYYTKNN